LSEAFLILRVARIPIYLEKKQPSESIHGKRTLWSIELRCVYEKLIIKLSSFGWTDLRNRRIKIAECPSVTLTKMIGEENHNR
jgi:hypothetical protein